MNSSRLARQEKVLSSAVYLSGAGAVVDFLLPLFAGAAMGLSASQIGILMAVELAVALVVRPAAGSLADRLERRSLACVGSLLYAVSCAGYALAPGPSVAYAAAAIGGLGGSLLWVSLRAMVGERLAEDSGVYARLVAAEETGEWVILVPALFALSILGYRGVFAGLAVCCLIGAAVLLTAPRHTSGEVGPVPDTGAQRPRLLRRLSPMLFAVVLTMIAEGVISLLLLLHLQREFALDPVEIGMVFLPGGIVMGILPTYLHGVETRYGRGRVLAVSSVASAIFAVSLAFAPTPAVIAVFWVFAGASWAVMLPVQQAVIAEASGQKQLGRGLGWYESATLAGGLVASLVAGFLYEHGSWQIACLVAAAVILSGAVIVPAAVRALGVQQRPREPEPLEDEEDEDESEDEELYEEEPEEDGEEQSTKGELLNSFAWHTAFLTAAIIAAHFFIDGSHIGHVFSLPAVPPEPLQLDTAPDWAREPGIWIGQLGEWVGQLGEWVGELAHWLGDQFEAEGLTMVLRAWILVWAMDLINTLWSLPYAPSRLADQED